MRVRKQTKVTGTHTTDVFFASIIAGVVTGVFMGPGVGILAAVAGFACGYPAARKEAREEANRLIRDDYLDAHLLDAMRRTGKRTITTKTELKNIHPNKPILGRLLFGDKLTKETKYYLDD